MQIMEETMIFFIRRIDYIALSILIVLYCVISYVAFNVNMDILPYLRQTPFFVAFEDPMLIYFGITVNISTSIPTIMELIMDIKSYRDLTFEEDCEKDVVSESDSWIERLFLAALSIVPGSILLFHRKDANLPYIYAIVHTLQTLGSMGMVLLICKKNVPKYFSSSNIFFTMFFTTLTSIASMLGFGHDMLYLPNILTYVFMCCGIYFLVWKISFPWMRDIWFYSISKKKPLSIEESCAMWYFMNTMVILMFVHSVVCIIKLFDWTNYDSIDINVFVYSFALYSVINSTVPGRLARIAIDIERKKMVQTKRALIRYMSHEVRSPLNVIYSGLNLLIEDVGNLPPTEVKNNLLETFHSIRHASGDLLQTMNDLLLLESMDSAAFTIEEKMVPCANLTQIAEKCGLVPREKGIVFIVNNQFDHPNHDLSTDVVKEQPDLFRDIELGANPAEQEDYEQLLFIDEHKIGQVLRNLITNSAKFTPPGQSIAVNIRQATAADLTEAECSNGSDNDDEGISGRQTRALAFAEENGYAPCGQVLIEVQDTGVGIAPENWGKVFGQFAQFDANKLQGGGGSGLGLWICQQLVNLHGSKVRFHSAGEGCGTRFFFTLPNYKKTRSTKVEEELVPMIVPPDIQQQPASLPPPRSRSFLFTAPGAQISPESFSDVVSSTALSDGVEADKFPRIVPRPLRVPGVCKALLVDDSSFNVKIMKNILKKVSTSWFRTSTATTDTSNEKEVADEGGEQRLHLLETDRSRAYMPADTSPSSPPSAVPHSNTVAFDLSEADDGAVAVQMVQAASEAGAPFDVVFMDNIMILMHGPEAAQAMRAAGFAGLIIGVTGNVMAEDISQYIQSGANHVLGKPVNIEDLKQILLRLT